MPMLQADTQETIIRRGTLPSEPALRLEGQSGSGRSTIHQVGSSSFNFKTPKVKSPSVKFISFELHEPDDTLSFSVDGQKQFDVTGSHSDELAISGGTEIEIEFLADGLGVGAGFEIVMQVLQNCQRVLTFNIKNSKRHGLSRHKMWTIKSN